VCLCLCAGHKLELCKTAEPFEMPFGMYTHVDLGNHVLDMVKIPTWKGDLTHCNCMDKVYKQGDRVVIKVGSLPHKYFSVWYCTGVDDLKYCGLVDSCS